MNEAPLNGSSGKPKSVPNNNNNGTSPKKKNGTSPPKALPHPKEDKGGEEDDDGDDTEEEEEEEYDEALQQQLDETVDQQQANSNDGAFYSEYEVKHSPRAAQFFIAGRGGETNHHVGNHQIRTLIMKHLPDYQVSPHRGKRYCRHLLADAANNEFANIKFVVRKSYFDKHGGARNRNETDKGGGDDDKNVEERQPQQSAALSPKSGGRKKSPQGQLSQDRIDSVLSMHSQSTLDALPDDVFLEIGHNWTVGIVQDLLRGGLAALHKSASASLSSSPIAGSSRAVSSLPTTLYSSSLRDFSVTQSPHGGMRVVVPGRENEAEETKKSPPPPPWQEFVRQASGSVVRGSNGAFIDTLSSGRPATTGNDNVGSDNVGDAEHNSQQEPHSITNEYLLVVPAATAPRPEAEDTTAPQPQRRSTKRRRSSSSTTKEDRSGS